MTQTNSDNTVLAHPDVISGNLIGYVRRTADGELELHGSIDSVGSELRRVPMDQMVALDATVTIAAQLQPSQHAWRWEPNAEFTVARLPNGDTHYMQVSATPTDDHPESSDIESAMIECWVRCASPEDALEIVRATLDSENWNLRKIDGPEIHTENDYVDEPELFQYYEQVQTDSEVFVYHVTPKPNAR